MHDDIESVKQRVNLVDLVQSYVPLRKAGGGWKGLCPFHQEKSPSFNVNEERQIFKCFGCNESGDAIDWLMKMEHLTFPEALQVLADRVGVILDKRKSPEQYAQEKDEKSRLYKINRLAADVFHKVLFDHPASVAVRSYLTERGLKEETLKLFKLGFAPPAARGQQTVLEKFLISREFSGIERKKAGSPERFTNRLLFPLSDVLGNVVGFTGRALDPNDQPKYLNTPETPIFKKSRVLYPLNQAKEVIKQKSRAILVEGQIDVLLAHQLGTAEAVATSGTALTAEHLEILRRYTNRIYFAFDADPAGVEATRKAILLAYDLELEPAVIELPLGFKDLGELAVKEPDGWSKAVEAAIPAFTWQLNSTYKVTPDAHSAAGKKAVGRAMLPLLARMRDPIERAHWVQLLGRRLGVSDKTVAEALERYLAIVRSKASTQVGSSKPVESSREPERNNPEEVLLGLLILHPAQIEQVRNRLDDPELAQSPRLANLAKTIKICYTKSGTTNQSDFVAVTRAALTSADAKWLDGLLVYVEQIHAESDATEIASEIQAGFNRLRMKRREQTKEDIARQIAEAEARGERSRLPELLKELQEVLKN